MNGIVGGVEGVREGWKTFGTCPHNYNYSTSWVIILDKRQCPDNNSVCPDFIVSTF